MLSAWLYLAILATWFYLNMITNVVERTHGVGFEQTRFVLGD